MIIHLDSKEINYLVLDHRGRVIESGEKEIDSLFGALVDLNSVEYGKELSLTFNGDVYTELNYKTTKIEM